MRRDGWPELLAEVVERHQGLHFEWGQSDCVSFFADCVLAVTGEDPAAQFRGWFSKRSAAARMSRNGLASIEDGVKAKFSEIPPAFAGRGDLIFPPVVDRMMAPAVVLGAHAVSRNEDGWVSLDRSHWHTAYRVE